MHTWLIYEYTSVLYKNFELSRGGGGGAYNTSGAYNTLYTVVDFLGSHMVVFPTVPTHKGYYMIIEVQIIDKTWKESARTYTCTCVMYLSSAKAVCPHSSGTYSMFLAFIRHTKQWRRNHGGAP